MEEQKNVEPYGALPDYQRPICAVLSENNAYKLIDDTGKVILTNTDNTELTSALSKKSKRYYQNYKKEYQVEDFPSQRIWIMGIMSANETDWLYKNIASCCNSSFNEEINMHIRQLIKNDNTKKGHHYFKLWDYSVDKKKVGKIAFFEISVDKYIEQPKIGDGVQDGYLSSVIYPSIKLQNPNMTNMLLKTRAAFIEGKLAAENDMRWVEEKENSGLWFPSGIGIDGDVYNYYYNITKKMKVKPWETKSR